jgi:Helix-turn-helix domain
VATVIKLEPVLDATDILTVEELALKLKVKTSWVKEQTRSRNRNKHPMPVLRVGKYIRFRWSEVSRWLLENQD